MCQVWCKSVRRKKSQGLRCSRREPSPPNFVAMSSMLKASSEINCQLPQPLSTADALHAVKSILPIFNRKDMPMKSPRGHIYLENSLGLLLLVLEIERLWGGGAPMSEPGPFALGFCPPSFPSVLSCLFCDHPFSALLLSFSCPGKL